MRLNLLRRAVFAGLAVLWLGLAFTQAIAGRRYREQSERNRTRLVHLPAARGSILDRNGRPLAEDRLSFELAALPQELARPEATWVALSRFLRVSPEGLAERYRKRFQARFAPVTLARNLPREIAFHLEEERGELPGILVRPIPQRTYPSGAAVGAALGTLGLIGPEELTRLKPYGYTIRDRIGKDGLELQYDSLLRGESGGLHLEVNAQGKLVQQLGYLPPRRGRRIRVSLDARLQELCHQLLREYRGAVLVSDIRSGEILLLDSSPSVDPGAFVDPDRQEEVLSSLRGPKRPLFNRAIRAVVPPGSTFKAAVAYEALREGKISPSAAFECGGQLQMGRSTFDCWREGGHGPQTVREALQHSCNVFFYNVGRRLGVTGVARAAREFSLDRPSGIDLPRESRGLVPDPAWMRKALRQPWREGDTVSFAIGQSALQVTPIEMLMLFTAIAGDGAVPAPHLLLGVEQPASEGKDPGQPHWVSVSYRGRENRIRMDRSALAFVKEGLERVVESDSGTGRLAQVPGVRVAGKTGTSQVPHGEPHAWFCGYAPADSPRVGLVVFLEHGGKGGLQAARLAGHLLAYLKEMGYLG